MEELPPSPTHRFTGITASEIAIVIVIVGRAAAFIVVVVVGVGVVVSVVVVVVNVVVFVLPKAAEPRTQALHGMWYATNNVFFIFHVATR